MSFLGSLMSPLFDRQMTLPRFRASDGRSVEALCQDLLTSHGEVSGTTLAGAVLDAYAALSDDEKLAFFHFLSEDLDLDTNLLQKALTAHATEPSRETYHRLMVATEPRRQELARRINQLPGATQQLVAMRTDLLRMLKDNPHLSKLDLDFQHLFKSWFNRGFLVLVPLNWESPAQILEKIIAYEAVHAIDSWEDLRRRLYPKDRRCFGYFHPSMPDEPLIFVEVALINHTANSIQDLLALEQPEIDAEEANTAVFYSISNCQTGLAGVSFGNSLIKQVVEDLRRDLPNIKTFITLSPVPGLMEWIEAQSLASETERPERLRELAAWYLCEAKDAKDRPLDPVARFHLTNGASLADIHLDADLSETGQARSKGVMVNYLYDLQRIGKNHENFVQSGKVSVSNQVRALLRAAGQVAA